MSPKHKPKPKVSDIALLIVREQKLSLEIAESTLRTSRMCWQLAQVRAEIQRKLRYRR